MEAAARRKIFWAWKRRALASRITLGSETVWLVMGDGKSRG